LRILTLALFLSGCGTFNASTAYVELPPSLLERCAGPVLLPERDLTRAEVVRWWGQDRASLLACASRHAGLASAVGPH
jgi:hypothetical protein